MRSRNITVNTIKVVLVIWFIVLSLFVFISSYDTLTNITEGVILPKPPIPPEAPIEFDQATIDGYKQKVDLYKSSVAAYDTHANVVEKSNRHATYELVIKKTLADFLTKFLEAFLAFAFVKATAKVVDNRIRMKNGKEPQPITILS